MKYRRPLPILVPSQGEFTYLPQVEIFEEMDAATLQTSVNAWLVSRIAVPDITFHITGVEYIPSQGNRYSCLVAYFAVEID